jgi:hypothetical protein
MSIKATANPIPQFQTNHPPNIAAEGTAYETTVKVKILTEQKFRKISKYCKPPVMVYEL